MKKETKKYWFKNKHYGWGWYPASKEGWAVVLVYILLALALVGFFPPETKGNLVSFIGGILVLTIALLIISWKKGEMPKWKWAGKPIGKK